MFCFLCNSELSEEIFDLFKKRICDESGLEKQSYFTIISSALSPLNISEGNGKLYSKIICEGCSELLNLYESIENKYIQLKCKIIVEYNKTAQKYGAEILQPEISLMKKFSFINNNNDESIIRTPTPEYLESYIGEEKSSELVKKISEELNFEEVIEYEPSVIDNDYFTIDEISSMNLEIFKEDRQSQSDTDNDNRPINNTDSEITSRDFKTYIYYCDKCGKSFTNSEHLENHKRQHIIKPYNCDICGKEFGHRSNLSTHIRSIHLKDNNYKCNICEESYSRKRQLECHIRITHTGERPFKCNICQSTFAYPHIYARHLKIHAGITYSCEICGKNFNSRDNRNSHRFIHSTKKRYECFCGIGFMKKYMLHAHMIKMGHDTSTIVSNSVIIE